MKIDKKLNKINSRPTEKSTTTIVRYITSAAFFEKRSNRGCFESRRPDFLAKCFFICAITNGQRKKLECRKKAGGILFNRL